MKIRTCFICVILVFLSACATKTLLITPEEREIIKNAGYRGDLVNEEKENILLALKYHINEKIDECQSYAQKAQTTLPEAQNTLESMKKRLEIINNQSENLVKTLKCGEEVKAIDVLIEKLNGE